MKHTIILSAPYMMSSVERFRKVIEGYYGINMIVPEVKQKLTDVSKKILDSEVIKIKINEVTKQLDKVRPTNSIVKDNQIMSLLLSYELLKEVTKQLKKEEAPNG